MVRRRHLGNVLIIMTKYVALRDDILTATYNGFSNMEIEGDFKVIVDYYNEKGNSPSSIMLLMENIWRLCHNLIIYYCHIYYCLLSYL